MRPIRQANVMAKAKTVYVCGECGHSAARWLGRCPACNAWNSLAEERERPVTATRLSTRSPALPGGGRAGPMPLSEVQPDAARRMPCGISR